MMEIEIINIEDIKPYKKNAKLHPQRQIDQIIESIKQFGNNDPIAIDEKNVIIEGHGRYEALKEADERLRYLWDKYEADKENVPKPQFTEAIALITMLELDEEEKSNEV